MIQFLLAEIYLAFISLGLPDSLPGSAWLIMIGLGCALIYPCIIHSTPAHFGADKSQAIIGVQMASAYIGILLMPLFFGVLAEHISVSLLPLFLFIILIFMALMYERLHHITNRN